MATSRFLKVNGVTGESEIQNHKEETECLTFQWGLQHPYSTQSGSGQSSGRTTFSEFTCSTYMDNAYPALAQACCSAKVFPDVKISGLKMGEKSMDFVTWTFTNVVVTSVSNSGSQDSQDIINYSFMAEKMKIEYKKQTSKGTAGGASSAEWDVKANK
jgi:type VI secretion system secreted protein Hcp